MTDSLPRFVAESTLGKLTKWLRMAGFDTIYDSHVPDGDRLTAFSNQQNRVVLTRTERIFRRLPHRKGLYIQSDLLIHQGRQVMQQLGLRRQDLRPLTRCISCNQTLQNLSKRKAKGCVPDYVWQQHDQFSTCTQCRRVFWSGTHSANCLGIMDQWF